MIRPPRDEERLLLVAATGGADRALAAWRDWRARVDFERLPDETVRLVPLLYRSLSRLGVAAPELARYASVYRHSWARNRLAFQAGARVIERLADAGIETIVLKGAAASVLYYRDDGVRAMEDVDVLVPRARLAATFEVLARAGWKVEQSRGPAPLSPAWLANRHSAGFSDTNGRSFDLHWYVSADALVDDADAPFWAASVPMRLSGVATRALCATDFLHHALAHAAWSGTPHLRWAADAMAVMNGPGASPIDWSRLVEHAVRRRMVLPLRRSLAWLRHELAAPVPEAVLAELAEVEVGRLARWEIDYANRLPPRPNAASKILMRLWFAHQRSSPRTGVALALDFPAYLARYFGVASPWELPAHTVRRAIERVRKDGL